MRTFRRKKWLASLLILCGLCVPAAAEDLNILISGNSFTQTNGDLNTYLGAMLKTDTVFAGNYDSINLLKTSISGTTLLQRSAAGGATMNAIQSATPYDYIILQEYSTGTQTTKLSETANINVMTSGAAKLYGAIRNSVSSDAEILLFETWERTGTISLETIQTGYGVLASAGNNFMGTDSSSIVTVGTTWTDIKNLTGLNLYHTDNYHQNVLGTYTNALKFYQKITGNTNVEGMYQRLSGNPQYSPLVSGITASDALLTEKVVSGTLTYDASQKKTYTGTLNLGSPTFQGVRAVSPEGTECSVYFVTASGSDTKLTTGTFNISNDAYVTLSDGASISAVSGGFSFVRIGEYGTGVLNVLSGSRFDSATHVIVGRRNSGGAATGFLNIDGAGSTVTINSMLYLGGWDNTDAASHGYVAVTDGASLSATGITLGRSSGSLSSMTVNNASVSTKNTGTFSWQADGRIDHTNDGWCGNLWVGASGNGVLNVQQGGTVSVSNKLYGGFYAASSANSIAVSGNGLLLVRGGETVLARTAVTLADTGRILVGNGVTAASAGTSAGLYVGAGVGGAGTATLTNGTVNGPVYVGYNTGAAGTAVLNITDSTLSGTLNVGSGSGLSASVNASGTNFFYLSGGMYVGNSAKGTLNVLSGTATVKAGDINVGNTSAEGEILIAEGAKLLVTGSGDTGGNWVRIGGTGTAAAPVSGKLTVYGTYIQGDSGTYTGFSGTVLGRYAYSTGTLLVSGENALFESLVNSGNTTAVGLGVGGYNGGSASTQAKGYAVVEKGAVMRVGTLKIGNYVSAVGEMTVDAASLSVQQPSGATAYGYALVGDTGKGTLTVRNGARMNVAANLVLGNAATGNGTLNIEGASVTTAGILYVGNQGTGTLSVKNASTASDSLKVTGMTYIGNNAAGNFTLSSGSVSMTGVSVGNNALGTVTLDGGIWKTGEVNAGTSVGGTGNIIINDGALWSVASSQYLRIGRVGKGSLTVNAGGTYSGTNTNLIIGRNVEGTLQVNGGTVKTKTLYVSGWDDDKNSLGTVNLTSGGTVNGTGLNAAASKNAVGVVNFGTAKDSASYSEVRSAAVFSGGVETAQMENGAWKVYPNYAAIIGAEGKGTVNVYNADVNFQKSVRLGLISGAVGMLNIYDSASVTVAGNVEIASGSFMNFILTEMNTRNVPLLNASEGIQTSDGASVTLSGKLSAMAQTLAADRFLLIRTENGAFPQNMNVQTSGSWQSLDVQGKEAYAVLSTFGVKDAQFGAMKTVQKENSPDTEYDLEFTLSGFESAEALNVFLQTLETELRKTDGNASVTGNAEAVRISNLDFTPEGIGIFAWNLENYNTVNGTHFAFTQLPEPSAFLLLLFGVGICGRLRKKRV